MTDRDPQAMAAAEDEADGASVVCIGVRDTGEDIPPEESPHIRERLCRGEAAREDGLGAGLGLALVKELIEALGGSVAVRSVLGEGSCFVVRLPK